VTLSRSNFASVDSSEGIGLGSSTIQHERLTFQHVHSFVSVHFRIGERA
jgi:hypothetical protein